MPPLFLRLYLVVRTIEVRVVGAADHRQPFEITCFLSSQKRFASSRI